MTVGRILEATEDEVQIVNGDSELAVAVHTLASRHVRALLVLNDHGSLEGVITERHVVRALDGYGDRTLQLLVRDVVPRNTAVCSPGDSVEQVLVRMITTRRWHLPVVDDGRVRGLVSIGDVVRHWLEGIGSNQGSTET